MLSLAYAAFALAWWPDSLWSADLPWAGALPSLISSPVYVAAFLQARRRRSRQAVAALVVGLFLLSVLSAWPRGAFCSGWYMQPILALLATTCLGITMGLSLTLAGVIILLVAALTHRGAVPQELAPTLWAHATSLAALTLGSALAGTLFHRLMLRVLADSERQQRRQEESARALRHRENLLRHALRVETVGSLASMVAHQLRNTFQVMMAHAALGMGRDASDPTGRLQAIQDALRDAAPLLDQLMVLANPQAGRVSAEDLELLVDAFHDRAARVLPAAIDLHRQGCGQALPVWLDERGLDHALWNLVVNARQAMPGGGRITLRTGRGGSTAWVAVADSGCGIPPEIRQRIFDPYFTTKPPGEGTGLGLAAVQRFVRGSNGSVHVRSEVGVGSEFVLSFPIRVPESAALSGSVS